MRTLAERVKRRVLWAGAVVLPGALVLMVVAIALHLNDQKDWYTVASVVYQALIVVYVVYALLEWRRLKAACVPGSCLYCGFSLKGLAQRAAAASAVAEEDGAAADRTHGSQPVGTQCPECGQHQPSQYPNGYPTKRR